MPPTPTPTPTPIHPPGPVVPGTATVHAVRVRIAVILHRISSKPTAQLA
ncbi:hypothetical protein ACWD0G_07375 [Streptomyces goshikiensis]